MMKLCQLAVFILSIGTTKCKWQKISSPKNVSTDDPRDRPQSIIWSAFCEKSDGIVVYGGRMVLWPSQTFFADLWQYNTTSNKWSHLSGNYSSSSSLQPVFGQLGEYSTDVRPAGQMHGGLHCNDDNSVLLLTGYPQNILSDRDFQFNLTSKLWRSVSVQLQNPSSARTVLRYGEQIALLPEIGLVLFGGTLNGGILLADVWIFDVKLMSWRCMKTCSNPTLQVAVYGDVGVPGDALTPGSRYYAVFGYCRNTSSIITFGGLGFTRQRVEGYLADTWSYSIDTNQWTFMGGSQELYSIGVNDGPIAYPRSRAETLHSMSPAGILFMFSGSTYNTASGREEFLADIWNYDPVRNEWRMLSDGRRGSGGSISAPPGRSGGVGFYSSSYGGFAIVGGVRESVNSTDIDFMEMWIYREDEEAKSVSTTTRAAPRSVSISVVTNEPVIYGILGVAGLISIVAISVYFYKIYVSKKAQAKGADTEPYGIKTNMNSYVVGGTTVGVMNEGLEIPGYLEVSPTDIQMVKNLSSGGGGDVVLAAALSDHLKSICVNMAVKVMKGCTAEMFYQEVGIMHLLSPCVNIARMIGYCSEPQMILMKFYSSGSLCDYMSKYSVQVALRLQFALDIANGVGEMHGRYLAHMDLKPQNVLIDIVNDRPTCVLTDFGITRILSEELLSVHAFKVTEIRGVSLRYASPESITQFRRKLVIKQVPAFYTGNDIYSLGSIFFYLACNVHPWE